MHMRICRRYAPHRRMTPSRHWKCGSFLLLVCLFSSPHLFLSSSAFSRFLSVFLSLCLLLTVYRSHDNSVSGCLLLALDAFPSVRADSAYDGLITLDLSRCRLLWPSLQGALPIRLFSSRSYRPPAPFGGVQGCYWTPS